jgi:hypothetical protein
MFNQLKLTTMKATIKTISIETLAEKINGKLWVKGDLKRIYVDEGYNTKKMSTKTYVYQKQDGTFGVSCKIECPSQSISWITSQEDEIINRLIEKIYDVIEEFGYEIETPEIETELDTEEQVQGYYMRWHEVRVEINSYGKLAYRKRQKVHTYKGSISKAPAGFVALNDNHFIQANEIERKETLFGFGETPNFKD